MVDENYVPTVEAASPNGTNGTIFHRAIDAIVDYIKCEHLREGDMLPSAEFFCEKFSFSRVIVREAMSYLKGMGIINSGKGSGFRLAKVDPLAGFANLLPLFFSISRDRDELSKLRCDLELGAFPDIVERISPAQLEALEQNIKESELLLQHEDFPNADFIRLDHQFHQIICSASGNRLLEIVSDAYFTEMSDNPDRNDPVLPKNRQLFREAFLAHQVILNSIKLHDAETGLLMLHRHTAAIRNKAAHQLEKKF